MKWYEIEIKTNDKYSDFVTDILHKVGSNGVLIEDNKELLPNKELGEIVIENNKEINSDVTLKGYFNEYENIIEKLKTILDNAKVEISYNLINDDWKEKWKEGFESIKITENILIKPSWDEDNYDEEIQVKIDPGMAFGTGTHETTSLSVKLLNKYLKHEDSVLDVGCGSGILSIVASKLGADNIVAIDIDEEAIKASKENFELNEVENIKVYKGTISEHYKNKTTNILIANILSEILMKLIDEFLSVIDENSIFISSGITVEKVKQIEAVYIENGLEIIEKIVDGNWVAIAAKRG